MIVSARKSQIEGAVNKIEDSKSIRSVKMNYTFLHLFQDMLSVFKPDGQPLVPVDLGNMEDVRDNDDH